MRIEGKLRNWNAQRGFGFIAVAGQDDVFVHIGAFPRDGIAPAPGEPLWFEIGSDARGRRCAIRLSRTAGGEAVKLRALALEPIAPSPDAASRGSGAEDATREHIDRRPRAATAAGPRDRRLAGDGGSGRRGGGTRGGRYRLVVLLMLLVPAAAGWQQWKRHHVTPAPPDDLGVLTAPPADMPGRPDQPPRSCGGRRHCSQMTSCEEATWFLRHCPGTEMDGNHDGVPCERQWCH